ncbi:UvrD-helicase domain-containing protein [Paenibacillus donghaensis]|uniref:HelD family protein n=1 Tax=Paenibacillus donghaensis TaxID=414771 RepID=UPI0018834B5D|nr:UvrD-helicase domain-containing protein [Paenibacillus donghaensis]MBE9915050.1 UvrD-helicase domain-containing protein [Paenibacillus donghaensis]
MEQTFQSAYQEEKRRLDATIAEIDRQLQRLRSIEVYTGHDFTEQVLEAGREEKRQALAKSLPAPYFGRLDFQGGKDSEPRPLYIGKIGVDHAEIGEQPMVIDWRAPIASVFYSFTGGDEPAAYEAPEGIIEGMVYLKRNLVIRQQILERVSDTFDRSSDQPAVSDEFLVYRLGENKDNKLRDIVSTIQAEQDKIIRAAKNTALIIQGVAGSGKTTVALHRLAYLLYQYKEQITAEKMIIFAPNHMFLDYISNVLPELGVADIQQSTFADWALQLLGIELPVADASETLAYWFESAGGMPEVTDEAPGRFKGSIVFMNMVRACVESMENASVPEADFIPWEGAVLSRDMILHWFHEEYKPYPLAKRKERVMARIHRWIEMELKKSPSATVLKERKKKASQREKSYASKWPKYEPLMLYKMMFKAAKMQAGWPEEVLKPIPGGIMKSTQKDLKQNIIREEDLPAFLYMHYLLNDITGEQRFDHIVIDEAQDFSPFQVAVLDLFVKGHSFTILGDLSQGIHAYRGVHVWEEMSSLYAPDQTAYFALTRSYRSTMEIIEFANRILEKGVKSDLLAVPVFRSGNPVRLIAYGNKGQQRAQELRKGMQKLSAGEYRTVAILTRTLQDAQALYERLRPDMPELHLIDGAKKVYEGGLSILPVYLSKGLEFDAVIVADADEQHYGASAWDAKLLYVGCTRALHELWLMHEGPLPDFLQNMNEEIAVAGW